MQQMLACQHAPALHVRHPCISSRSTLRSFSTIGEFCEGSVPLQHSSALGSSVVSSSRALVKPDFAGPCILNKSVFSQALGCLKTTAG